MGMLPRQTHTQRATSIIAMYSTELMGSPPVIKHTSSQGVQYCSKLIVIQVRL